MKCYKDRRPQLADAALVYLANREEIDRILTLDCDFSIDRSGRKRTFQNRLLCREVICMTEAVARVQELR